MYVFHDKKNEKHIDKYMTIWEKVSDVIIYLKKYLKAEKRFNTKECFQCFYIPLILLESVYRKDGNYNPKVFLKTLFITFFGEV